jgi:glycosyltransferase involved in cell wall biosynthesis
MKISVVTVSYNAAGTIGHTLSSFLEQAYPDKELLVVDGGSTDGTVELVEKFKSPAIRLVSEPDEGLYDAMNKGLSQFTGDAVGFLNADDRYQDAAVLGDLAHALAEADIVYGDLDFVDGHDTGRIVRSWRGEPWSAGAFSRGWMPAHPTFYVRRKVVEATGRFDTSLKIAADYDYMLRALELGRFRHQFLQRVMVRMMVGGKSTSGITGYLKSNFEALKARRRHIGAGLVDYALVAKPLGKAGQFFVRRG